MSIREKIWDIDIIVEEIKNIPQTYNTILGTECADGTCQTLLRRKLNRLFKDGVICKMIAPGTRYGKIVFYVPDKKYNILVEGGRTGSNIYYFFNFKQLSKYYIFVEKIWELNHNKWKEEKKKTFFEGNVLMWI